MRSSRRARSGEAGMQLNLTPMIDMVFLLLIYFLFTLALKTQQGLLSTETPAGQGQAADVDRDVEEEEARVRIVRAEDGVALFFRGWPVAGFRDLRRELGDVPEDAPVLIDAAPDVHYRDVVRVHNVCLKSGHRNVVFTLPPY